MFFYGNDPLQEGSMSFSLREIRRPPAVPPLPGGHRVQKLYRGKVRQTFHSVEEAAEAAGVPPKRMHIWLKRAGQHKGVVWRWESEA